MLGSRVLLVKKAGFQNHNCFHVSSLRTVHQASPTNELDSKMAGSSTQAYFAAPSSTMKIFYNIDNSWS